MSELEVIKIKNITKFTDFLINDVSDEYIPVSLRTNDENELFSPNYIRLGNYETTLLEIQIDSLGFYFRGLTLTTFSKLSDIKKISFDEEKEGLPVFNNIFEKERIIDLKIDFNVFYEKNVITIHWQNDLNVDLLCNFKDIDFLINDNSLVGIRYKKVSDKFFNDFVLSNSIN